MKVNTMQKCIALVALCACTILKPAASVPVRKSSIAQQKDCADQAIEVLDAIRELLDHIRMREWGAEIETEKLRQVALACLRGTGIVNPSPEQVEATIFKISMNYAPKIKRESETLCVIL